MVEKGSFAPFFHHFFSSKILYKLFSSKIPNKIFGGISFENKWIKWLFDAEKSG